jgi:hypothetical protein
MAAHKPTPNTAAAELLVERLFNAAFMPGRPPRSAEYRHGVRALLMARVHCRPVGFPFDQGTTAFDAFAAGVDEGCAMWRRYIEQELQG